MDFSRRSAQSCSCHVTGAGATGVSSPIRTNEAMSAPPERNFKVARPEGHSSAPGASNELMSCDWLSPQNNTSVRIRVTPVLLNYRRLRVDGQRLRCAIAIGVLSNGNTSRSFQNPVNEGAQWLREGLALELRNGWLFTEQARRELCPHRRGRREWLRCTSQHQRVGAVQGHPSRILKIFFRWINHRKIQARPQELQQGIAFHDQWRQPLPCFSNFLLQRSPQKGQPFREKPLLRPEPERAPRARRQKSPAIRSGIRLRLPVDGAHMLIRGAITILAILRADAVPVLSNFPRNPVRLAKRGNHVAHQLCLPNAARVTAHDDHAPVGRNILVNSRQVSPLVL